MRIVDNLTREPGLFSAFNCKNGLQKKALIYCSHLLSLSIIATLLFLSACQKEDATPEGDGLTDDILLEVPSTPTFEVTNPLRSSMLQVEDSESALLVEGQACDDINPITSVSLNNSSVSLSDGDCKTFSTELASAWGLNIIDGFAENALEDQVSLVQSYLCSPEYLAAPDASGLTGASSSGWVGRLTQEVLDDGNRNDPDDLATLLQFEISATNFDEYIPQVIVNEVATKSYTCWPFEDKSNRHGYKVEKAATFNIGEVYVDYIMAGPGTIKVNFEIGESSFPINVDGYFDNGKILLGCTGELHAGTSGSVGFERARANGTFDVTFNGGEIVVELIASNINLTDPYVNINLTGVELIDELLSDAATWVLSWFEVKIESLLEDLLKDQLSTVIEETINEFTLDPTIDIPAPIDMQLLVLSKLDDVKVYGPHGSGYIDLSLTASVRPPEYKKSESQLTRGSILGMSALPSFSGMSGTFAVGMKDDFVNQVLWATWAGGGFDIEDGSAGTISEYAGEAGLDANVLSVETGLPPVLMPGDNGSEVKIGIGEVMIKSEVNPVLLGQLETGLDKVEITSYVSMILTGTFELDPETREISFVLSEDPDIHVQIENYVLTDESVDLEGLLGLFARKLLKKYITDVLKSIELPSIPVGENVEGVPNDLTWVLANGQMDHVDGFFRIIGDVGVENE